MAKSRQGRQNKAGQKDGQYRKESKEERKARLERQAKAREACERLLPYAGAVIVFFLLAFSIYVRSVPPKAPKVDPAATTAYQGEIPEYFNVDTQPLVKEAMDEAEQVMKNMPKEANAGDGKSNVFTESKHPDSPDL